MSVALDAAGAQAQFGTVSGTTGTTYSGLTVGSGTNRALVVGLDFDDINDVSPVVKWDSTGTPQTLSQITTLSITQGRRIYLFGGVAPTSGLKTLSVTWNTDTASGYVNAIAWTGADQTGGSTTFANPQTASAGGVTPVAITTTGTSSDASVTALACDGGVHRTATTGTSWWADSSGPGGNAYGDYKLGVGSISDTIDGAKFAAMVGCTIKAAAASGTPFNQFGTNPVFDYTKPSPLNWYQSWEQRHVQFTGLDKFPTGESGGLAEIWADLPPMGSEPKPYRSWEYNNTRYYGKDTVNPGKQVYDRPQLLQEDWRRGWEQANVIVYSISLPVGKTFSDRPSLLQENWRRGWEWSNIGYYGKDTVNPGSQYYDTPAPIGWYRSWEQPSIKTVFIPFKQTDWPNPQPVSWYRDANQNLVLIFPSGKPFNQQDYPNPTPVTWYKSWEQPGLSLNVVSVVVLPFNQSNWPNPSSAGWYKEWTWSNTGYYGKDTVNPGQQFYVLPPGQRLEDWRRGYEQGLNLPLVTITPRNQSDWPLPPPVSWYKSWEWNNVKYLGLDTLVPGQQLTDIRVVKDQFDRLWIVNLLQNTLTPVPPPTSSATDIHFKPILGSLGRMGNLGGLS